MQLMEKLKNHFSCASDYFACISKDYFVPTRTADGVCRVIHFRGVKIIELDYLQFYITDSLEFILVAQFYLDYEAKRRGQRPAAWLEISRPKLAAFPIFR